MRRTTMPLSLTLLFAFALTLFTACGGPATEPAPSFEENLEAMARYTFSFPNPAYEEMLDKLTDAPATDGSEPASGSSWEEPIRAEMAKYWAADKIDQAMQYWYINGGVCAGTGYTTRVEDFALTAEAEDLQRDFSLTLILLDPEGNQAGSYTVTGRARESTEEPGKIEYFSLLAQGDSTLAEIRKMSDPQFPADYEFPEGPRPS